MQSARCNMFGGRSWIMYSKVQVEPGLNMAGGGLQSEVQCILGNGHVGPLPPGQNDWLTDRHDWKHYLAATSLAGGRKIRVNEHFIFFLFKTDEMCAFSSTTGLPSTTTTTGAISTTVPPGTSIWHSQWVLYYLWKKIIRFFRVQICWTTCYVFSIFQSVGFRSLTWHHCSWGTMPALCWRSWMGTACSHMILRVLCTARKVGEAP